MLANYNNMSSTKPGNMSAILMGDIPLTPAQCAMTQATLKGWQDKFLWKQKDKVTSRCQNHTYWKDICNHVIVGPICLPPAINFYNQLITESECRFFKQIAVNTLYVVGKLGSSWKLLLVVCADIFKMLLIVQLIGQRQKVNQIRVQIESIRCLLLQKLQPCSKTKCILFFLSGKASRCNITQTTVT